MAILNSTACKYLRGRIEYVCSQVPHNTDVVKRRSLLVDGNYVNLITEQDSYPSAYQSGYYIEEQFIRVLKRAKNPNRQYQLQSIIVSFSSDEFSLSNREDKQNDQSSQALKLIKGFAQQFFDNAQYFLCVQGDGIGGKLHIHLLINTIRPDGKAVRTNLFNVFFLRKQLNDYLSKHFKHVTRRKWPVLMSQRQDIGDINTKVSWITDIKEAVKEAKKQSVSLEQFKVEMLKRNVELTIKQGHIQYFINHNGKQRQIRDIYQSKGKNGQIRTTKGLGQDFTLPSLLLAFEQNRLRRI